MMLPELEQFATWLRSHRRAKANTIRSYVGAVRRYLESGLTAPDYLLRYDDRTYNVNLAAITAWHEMRGEDLDLRRERVSEKPIQYLDVDQVKLWLKELQAESFRAYVVATLMYTTGLRMGEVVGARMKHLDLEHGILRVRGKGRKWRDVPLLPMMVDMLREYIADHRYCHLDSPRRIFLNDLGLVYSAKIQTPPMKRAAARAGIPELDRPNHAMRHACITHAIEAGANIAHLSQLAGHADPKTTMRYIAVTPEHLRELVSKHPLAQEIKQPGLTVVEVVREA